MVRRNPSAAQHLQEADIYIKGAQAALREDNEQAAVVRLALADKELKHAFGEPGVARLKKRVLNIRRKYGLPRVNPETRDNPDLITHVKKAKSHEHRARHSQGANRIEALFQGSTEYEAAYEDPDADEEYKPIYAQKARDMRREARMMLENYLEKNPVEDEDFEDDEDVTLLLDPSLGGELHQWHSGMGDPIYRVGSLIYAGHPVTTEDVEEARDRLEYLWERRAAYDDEAVEQLGNLLDNMNHALEQAGVED